MDPVKSSNEIQIENIWFELATKKLKASHIWTYLQSSKETYEQLLGIAENRKRQMHYGQYELYNHRRFQYQPFVSNRAIEFEIKAHTIHIVSSQHKAAYTDFEYNFFVVGLQYHRQTGQSQNITDTLLYTDHLELLSVLHDVTKLKQKFRNIATPDKKHYKVSQFNLDLIKADWIQTFSTSSGNQQINIFSRIICEILQKHAPRK